MPEEYKSRSRVRVEAKEVKKIPVEKEHSMSNGIRGLTPNLEPRIPPLPDAIPLPEFSEPLTPERPLPQLDPRRFPPFLFRSLRCGSYLLNYTPQT